MATVRNKGGLFFMKKALALCLVLILAIGTATTAFAATDYQSDLIKGLGYSTDDFMADNRSRVLACMVVIIAYAQVHPDGTEVLSSIGVSCNAKIANWGHNLDVYLPTPDGKYLNLFFNPSSGKIQDYGITTSISTRYTYTDVAMSEVTDMLVEFLESMD